MSKATIQRVAFVLLLVSVPASLLMPNSSVAWPLFNLALSAVLFFVTLNTLLRKGSHGLTLLMCIMSGISALWFLYFFAMLMFSASTF